MKKKCRIIIALSMAALCYMCNLPVLSAQSYENNLQPSEYAEGSYGAYNEANADNSIPSPSQNIVISAAAFSAQEDADTGVGDYQNKSGVLLWNSMSGSVTWDFTVDEAGLYNISLNYCPIKGNGSAIDLGIKIDGQFPFSEAQSTTFDRSWKDDSGMKTDEQGNEYTPEISEMFIWTEEYFRDVKGYYQNNPYSFYFTAGTHSVAIICNNEAFAVEKIICSPIKQVKSYKEVSESYEQNGYQKSNAAIKYIQAETPYLKSDQTLRAQYDRNSPLTQPFNASHIRYNCIGANAWKYQSQWISWEIDVPQDGLYLLGSRYRQELIKGFTSARRLTIDGELPFAEAAAIDFNYSEEWQLELFGDDDNPYLFYFTKGKHVLKLEVVMGNVSAVVGNLQNVNDALMRLYRRIIAITGTTPDPYRDYSIDETITDMIKILEEARKILRTEKKNLENIIGSKSINTTTMQTLISQIESVIDTPDSLITSSRLSNFSSNISGLSSWLLDLKYQPLTIDYFVLMSPDDDMPRCNASFFENLKSGFANFISSFIQDYSTAGDNNENGNITIWLSVGRDQMQVIKNMISDTFTPESEVGVDVKLVSASLIQAILAQNGPDVAIMTARNQPVDLAVRNALVDLSLLDGFEQVKERFILSALVPYEFNNGCYGLPDSMTYGMMFYRKDIFNEMNLKVPQTWDELLELAPILQRNGMKIGLPDSTTLYPALLMQRGINYYNDSLTDTNFKTEEAYNAFLQWTDYYTLHGFPLEYNFYNLFRTGEIPVGITTYIMFNTLKVAAPEIDGLWEMTPMPGTLKADGTVDRTISASGTASIIFKHTDNLDASWEFLKWWTSDATQTRYALDIESTLGLSARPSTANIKSMQSMPWTKSQLEALELQRNFITEIPQVPGDYYVSRNLNNAFNNTVVSDANARESFNKWSNETSIELERKRKEFGLEG